MKQLPIVAIVGRPNVGKSSLFNRLVGKRQAVVADEPGTTRDPVQNLAEWNGRGFWLVDTAGISAAANPLDQDVQTQITESREAADVIILVVDARSPLNTEDRLAAKAALKTGKPVLLAVNKIDATANQLPAEATKLGVKQALGVSAIHGTGSGDLLDAITALLPKRTAKTSRQPAVALLGRPNVGKSSLFNGLVGDKKAIVSDVSGTTRDVNRAELTFRKLTYQVFDTAGIRRPGKAKGIEKFSILRTLQAINECDVAVIVIDATELGVALDQKIVGLAKEAGKGIILALNKWDLVEDKEATEKRLGGRLQREFAFAWWAPVVLTSAVSGHNVSKLMEQATKILQQRATKLKTTELNQYLNAAVSKHPPAGLKNKQPKLRYVTQTSTQPPTFSFFGSQTEFLHWSYKRYLEKALREQFGFTGTSVNLIFSNK